MSKNNHALRLNGGIVVLATSSDERHPPEHMIDADRKTFWVSTGLFPQVVVISFLRPVKLDNIRICCFDVRNIVVETADSFKTHDKDEYEKLFEKEMLRFGTALQIQDIPGQGVLAKYMRISINSAYHHFISIHHIVVEGEREPVVV